MRLLDYRLKDREVLGQDDGALSWAVIKPIWFLKTPAEHPGLRSWRWRFVTDGQLLVYSVTWLEREVNNGGFAQYFWNPAGSFWRDALRGLDAFCMEPYARLLKSVAARFPGGEPSLDRADRIRRIEAFAEEERQRNAEVADYEDITVVNDTLLDGDNSTFYDLYDHGHSYYAAMAGYIRNNPSEFFK